MTEIESEVPPKEELFDDTMVEEDANKKKSQKETNSPHTNQFVTNTFFT